ncbi:hypothetical protein L5515_008376 [Caenorhabditis briggsae]|uniref:Uncharacterized protein n=1 Tax=Caenorhabditis briggsae TaxID=6238 RepID=A0AAE9F557_CAEBR|nr:hypothetical protein L5515_008376 [Caenorhabditis briggsae]
MKTILFVFFCALIAVSLAKPQVSYGKNGPAKLHKARGDDGDGDGGYGDGTGGLKLNGDDGSHENGEPVAVTGGPIHLDEEEIGVPFAITGAPKLQLSGDDKSDNGEPVVATGEPKHIVVYKVSSGVVQKKKQGKSIAHYSRNGPHVLVARL